MRGKNRTASRYSRYPAITVLVLAAALLLTAVATAAPKAPKLAAPRSGSAVQSVPAFAWAPVRGADAYEFQISASKGFDARPVRKDRFFTKNTRATLTQTLPDGTYWWRVRSVGKEGSVSRWSAARSIRKAWASRPQLLAPANGSSVTYPTAPLRLAWNPVPGAAKYLVSIARDPSLGSLLTRNAKPIETAAASLTPSEPLPLGVYYWGVTPVDASGNRGQPSAVFSFTWSWPTFDMNAEARLPVVDLVDAPELFDPHFSWTPITGAARYEVEVNSTQDFSPGSKVCCTGTTTGTSLSPVQVLRDNVYYWRVRAIDTEGNVGDGRGATCADGGAGQCGWKNGEPFTKSFDKVPPVSGTSIKNLRLIDLQGNRTGMDTQIPIVAWDPVPGASSYTVEVVPFRPWDDRCDWTAPRREHWLVQTAVSAWTPLGTGWLSRQPYPDRRRVSTDGSTSLAYEQPYCVRVRARADRDASRAEVYGDFTYLDGAANNGVPNDANKPSFRFTSLPYVPGELAATTAADYILPGPRSEQTPLLTWRPIRGAASYYVIVARDSSFSNVVDYAFVQFPAYAPRLGNDPVTYPDEETKYYWAVLPASSINGAGAIGDPRSLPAGEFLKLSTPPALMAPTNGQRLSGQPAFRWGSVPGARRYRVQVSQDPTFGRLFDDVTTSATSYTSTTTYPAATTLYWRVRADDENLVGLRWSQTGAFSRAFDAPDTGTSNPARGDLIPTWTWKPVAGAVSYDVRVELPNGKTRDFLGLRSPAFTAVKMTGTGVFRWQVRANFPRSSSGVVPGPYSAPVRFVRTIRQPLRARASVARGGLVFSWQPKLGADSYRVQVSRRPDFSRRVEDVQTDNPSYASELTRNDYREGGRFYWRVVAIDADNNIGDYTPAKTFRLPARKK